MRPFDKIEKQLDSAVKVTDVAGAFAALIARPASALSATLKVLPFLGVFFEFICILLRQKSMSEALHVSMVDRGAQYFVASLLALSVLVIGLSFVVPALVPALGVMYAIASSLITLGAFHHLWLLKRDPEYQALRVYVKWMGNLETQKLKEVHGLMTHDQLNEKALGTELEKRGIPLPDGFEKIMALRSSLPPAQFKEAFDVQKYIEKRMDIKDSALSCGYNTAVTAVMIAAMVSLSVFFPISTIVLAGVAMAYVGFSIMHRINRYVLKCKSERIRHAYQSYEQDIQQPMRPNVVQSLAKPSVESVKAVEKEIKNGIKKRGR